MIELNTCQLNAFIITLNLHDISVLSVVILLQGDEDHFHRSTKESVDKEDLLKLLVNQNDSDYKNKTSVSTT